MHADMPYNKGRKMKRRFILMKAIDALFDLGDRYAAQSSWKDFALTKFCLCSMGVVIGMYIPREHRTKALCGCAAVFPETFGKVLRIRKRS